MVAAATATTTTSANAGPGKLANPLDTSDRFAELMFACRVGDLKSVQEHISAGVNINSRDQFDYTPLIIACLVGHYELVQLLLEAGALAERSTFQGERAVYGALNDKIRNLLLKYDYTKSTDPWIYWSTHVTSLLTKTHPRMADLGHSETETMQLHRFFLAARVPFLERRLRAAKDEEAMEDVWRYILPAGVPAAAVRAALRWLYLSDQIEDTKHEGGRGDGRTLAGLQQLADHWGAERLKTIVGNGNANGIGIGAMESERTQRELREDDLGRARGDMVTFFENNVLGRKMVVESDSLDSVRWTRANDAFADCLVRVNILDSADGTARGFDPIGAATAYHVAPPRQSPRAIFYPVHKAMLVRAPYFSTMFASPFAEGREPGGPDEALCIITADCTPATLEATLRWLYTEHVVISLEIALDVLYFADMLFLEKLKNKAAVAIGALSDRGKTAEQDEEVINIYDVVRAAWDLKVPRLEESAARYLAARLEHYIYEDEFADLILESAFRVKERQETDTIELLDDIRYHLNERFKMRFEDLQIHSSLRQAIKSDKKRRTRERPDQQQLSNEGDEEELRLRQEEKEREEDAIVEAELADEDVEADAGAGEQSAPEALWQGKTNGTANGTATAVRHEEAMVDLDGKVVADEFEMESSNYAILLRKIDELLERLKLDA